MKVLLQRVTRAEVRVEGASVARIERGLVVLLGVLQGDDAAVAERLAEKIAHWRCFADDDGRMNLDVRQAHGSLLVVSQFTLAASTRRGLRPSFDGAEEPEKAREMYLAFVETLRARGIPVETGTFGAMMEVDLVNDGPVTFLL